MTIDVVYNDTCVTVSKSACELLACSHGTIAIYRGENNWDVYEQLGSAIDVHGAVTIFLGTFLRTEYGVPS